ncbi:MAG: hypothetical protein IJO55_12350 [Lachnospiraceae bacterium]|nr:hypothetical protein [Lachnospiraceae bacterium]MBQ6857522.1 hypothetical protein [Lachnospiraceae bacterium]
MRKFVFLFSLVFCLLSMTLVGFAAPTEAEKQKYAEAIETNLTEMLKGSIALDKGSADNKTYLLNWLLAETQPKEAKKIVTKIEKLEAEQAKDRESMDPYLQAKKICDEKLNADGANAALENVIRIQKDWLKDQEEITALWKKVDLILKKESPECESRQ